MISTIKFGGLIMINIKLRKAVFNLHAMGRKTNKR